MNSVIQFSGGRTSGYMLRLLLDEHGGSLPADWKVCFENTGKEREETLDFIEEVSLRWSVPIIWLEWDDVFDPSEYDRPDGTKRTRKLRSGVKYRVVNHSTASRKGEPFLRMIQMIALLRKYTKEEPPLLPNVAQRICTDRLKLKVLRSYLAEEGIEDYDCYLGIRKDEERRFYKMQKWSPPLETIVAPLMERGVLKADVHAFWKIQPFDLQLDSNSDEGNCDLCFLKATGKLIKIMRANREREKWWIGLERLTGATFSQGKPSFQQLAAMIDADDAKLATWTNNEADKTVDCFCGE